MDQTSNLITAINSISLEAKEEGGLDLLPEESQGNAQLLQEFNAKLCFVAHFLSDGHVDFWPCNKH